MIRINRWLLRTVREDFLKGSYSFVLVFLFFCIVYIAGFKVPEFLEIIQFDKKDLHDLGSDLLAGFLGVSGVALAIAAIVLSILQIANRKIQINELIFKNSFFAPTFYFGLLNIIFLSFLGLFYSQSQIFKSEFILSRLIITNVYLFLFYCVAIAIVFFRVFQYLNFSNILNVYFRDTLELVRLEQQSLIPDASASTLSQRGREIFQEIKGAIESEDNILLERMLTFLQTAFQLNPTSNLLFGMTLELEVWIILSKHQKNSSIYFFLINFWRELMDFSAKNPNSSARSLLLGIAGKVISK